MLPTLSGAQRLLAQQRQGETLRVGQSNDSFGTSNIEGTDANMDQANNQATETGGAITTDEEEGSGSSSSGSGTDSEESDNNEQ